MNKILTDENKTMSVTQFNHQKKKNRWLGKCNIFLLGYQHI